MASGKDGALLAGCLEQGKSHGENGGAGRKRVGMDLLVVQKNIWEVTLENPNH